MNQENNYKNSCALVGYLSREKTIPKVYSEMGFRCGLEIHQQLKSDKKLFCHCPAGLYQKSGDYDAEIVRHMRPTLSELGEYDGTALMEFKTKKNIIYRIKNNTACTYEIDDTPPFLLNRDALKSAMKIALLLKTSIVGELHITRKQYLDGSIPTGFQRTAILGIEGSIPLSKKRVRIIQLSIEEDSCREVSDVGHDRIYMTDRLGMPLIEMVTYPDMLTPDEATEAGQYLRFLTRSAECVNTGIGAGRQDVNVSISGGSRVEIKGVSRIKWIPELTHNEAFRQKALLEIRKLLVKRIPDKKKWNIASCDITDLLVKHNLTIPKGYQTTFKIIAVNLPQFKDLLSFFTQPGKVFANEISDRLKVVACLEKPNMTHSESEVPVFAEPEWDKIFERLKSKKDDAQIVFWGPEADMAEAVETVKERCLLVFEGVPNETRKALPDGTTIFERVLPGPDRMYPDTDSAPIPVDESLIEETQKDLPKDISERLKQMTDWKIPKDTYTYMLSRNYYPLLEKIIRDFNLPPIFVGTLIGQQVKNIEGRFKSVKINPNRIYDLVKFVCHRKLKIEIIKEMLPVVCKNSKLKMETILETIDYKKISENVIFARIPKLKKEFGKNRRSKSNKAEVLWIMGQLRRKALGNIDMARLRTVIEGGQDE